MEYLNPVHSSAASITAAGSTYHTLSGQAAQILMCTTVATVYFYFSFDTTGALTAPCTKTAMFCPGNYPLLVPVNHPSFINVIAQGTGYLYITEFV